MYELGNTPIHFIYDIKTESDDIKTESEKKYCLVLMSVPILLILETDKKREQG